MRLGAGRSESGLRLPLVFFNQYSVLKIAAAVITM